MEKTGPGQAIITHHNHTGTAATKSATGQDECGCEDWRTDQDIDADNKDSDWDVFPTGLYRTEWPQTMKPDLDARAEAVSRERALAAIQAAKARCRERFATPTAEKQG